jgi:flavin reductase (DIM6/NTAB) family NADH-FMN oxidoreductase RutF
MQSGCFHTGIPYKGVISKRCVSKQQRVDVYRNLNRSNCFSIRPKEGEFKDKVSGYAPCVIVKNAQFVTSKTTQQKVKLLGQKSVHAYLRGELVDAFDATTFDIVHADVVRVSYNPHISHEFFTLERDAQGNLLSDTMQFIQQPPVGYDYAVVSGRDVLFVKSMYRFE